MEFIIDNPRKNFRIKNNIIFIEIKFEINKLDIIINDTLNLVMMVRNM